MVEQTKLLFLGSSLAAATAVVCQDLPMARYQESIETRCNGIRFVSGVNDAAGERLSLDNQLSDGIGGYCDVQALAAIAIPQPPKARAEIALYSEGTFIQLAAGDLSIGYTLRIVGPGPSVSLTVNARGVIDGSASEDLFDTGLVFAEAAVLIEGLPSGAVSFCGWWNERPSGCDQPTGRTELDFNQPMEFLTGVNYDVRLELSGFAQSTGFKPGVGSNSSIELSLEQLRFEFTTPEDAASHTMLLSDNNPLFAADFEAIKANLGWLQSEP